VATGSRPVCCAPIAQTNDHRHGDRRWFPL
jgi:hypothetical protein